MSPKITSIASVVGDDPSLNGKYCIDHKQRTWKIETRHSGCILKGINVEATIPYWACYFIELPGLRILESSPNIPWKEDKPTAVEEIIRLSSNHKDIVRDERNQLLWIVKISEHGISLDGYEDNYSLPQSALNYLSLGKLDFISSEADRKARKREKLK